MKRKRKNGRYVYIIKEFEFFDIGHGKIQIVRTKKGTPYFKEFIERWSRDYPVCIEKALCFDKGGVSYYFKRVTAYVNWCLVAKLPLSLISNCSLHSE